MFCRECGREFKEGAKVCEGCGKSLPGQRDSPKQNRTGWAMIVLGVILVGFGLYFAYEVAGIASIILGVIVAILGITKVR